MNPQVLASHDVFDSARPQILTSIGIGFGFENLYFVLPKCKMLYLTIGSCVNEKWRK
jgi:hypothetical protein